MPAQKEPITAHKIIVVGSPGAGKTTFAKRLAHETGLPLFHMDEMFWAPHWLERGNAEFTARLNDALAQDKWIIDGNYISSMQLRLARADAVYFIDVPAWKCTYRIIKRWLRREGQQAEGCPQRVDLAFIKYVAWTFPRSARLRLLALIKSFAAHGQVHHIK
jgi:adenylate kinase family enzyme